MPAKQRPVFKRPASAGAGPQRKPAAEAGLQSETQEAPQKKQRAEEGAQHKQGEDEALQEEPHRAPALAEPEPDTIAALCRQLSAVDPKELLETTRTLRKKLSVDSNPPIQEAIDAGAVPYIVGFLKREEPALQFEAAWVLANIASGTEEQAREMVELGSCPILVGLLSSNSSADLCEMAVWTLGNIAGAPVHRDTVLLAGALPLLLTITSTATTTGMVQNAAWALCNLVGGNPPPRFDLVAGAVQQLVHLTFSSDSEVMVSACSALAHLTEGSSEEPLNALIRAGFPHRLTELAGHGSKLVRTPVLKAVRNFVAADWRRLTLDKSVLQTLKELTARSGKA